MFPANSWVFDLEIYAAIPIKGRLPEPGVRYCKHWGDHQGMGISCLVAARPDGSDVLLFTNDYHFPPNSQIAGKTIYPLSRFEQLVGKADLLIGYGSRFFDAKVLACFGIYIPAHKHLDFLHEAKKTLRNAAPKGYKLHDVSQRCGGPPKSDSGADAPALWQRGHYDRVFSYCKNDVQMICAIAQHYAITGGCIPNPHTHFRATGIPCALQLRTPQQIAIEDKL